MMSGSAEIAEFQTGEKNGQRNRTSNGSSVDAINNILPKTSEKNNLSIKKALDLAGEHYDIKGDTKNKK